MCLEHGVRDTEATSNGNGSSLGEGAISPVALENGGAPGIPRVVTSIPRSRDRSYFCLYFSKYYSRRLRRFRASSAKVWAVTEDGEMDDVEMDSVETGNEDGSSTSSKETAPNSPSSRCDGNKEAVQDADSKPEDEGKETTSRLGRLLLLYSDSLDKSPVITKSISSGLIGMMGDIVAQMIEWGFGDSPAPWSDRYMIWRSCAVMMDGLFVNGPLLHYAYDILERYMPAGESVLGAVMQVGIDVFVIDPLFAFFFVWSTGLFEGLSVEHDILHTLRYNFLSMVMWLVVIGLCWAPLQIYLFNRYPVQFRVLVADFIDVVWTCVTSFFSHVRRTR
ncbi:unnamed protein product [Ascophyllum nodosum]